MSSNTFKLFDKSGNLFKYLMFFSQVQRVQRTHFGQDTVKVSSILTYVFTS